MNALYDLHISALEEAEKSFYDQREIKMTQFVTTAILNTVVNLSTNLDPLWQGGPTGKEYVEGFVRIDAQGNNRGSYVSGLDTLAKTVAWLCNQSWSQLEYDPETMQEGHSYFECQIYDRKAYQGVLTLGEIDNWDDVSIRQGAHGTEMCIKRDEKFKAVFNATLIVNNDDREMVTWFPGELTPPSPEVYPENKNNWEPKWAVKII